MKTHPSGMSPSPELPISSAGGPSPPRRWGTVRRRPPSLLLALQLGLAAASASPLASESSVAPLFGIPSGGGGSRTSLAPILVDRATATRTATRTATGTRTKTRAGHRWPLCRRRPALSVTATPPDVLSLRGGGVGGIDEGDDGEGFDVDVDIEASEPRPLPLLRPASALIIDVDNTLYSESEARRRSAASSSSPGVEGQIVSNTHAFGMLRHNLTSEECDDLYREHGSTVEGLRRAGGYGGFGGRRGGGGDSPEVLRRGLRRR